MLDRYSDSGVNDAEEFAEMTIAQRRAAEAKMAQRDRREQGGRRGMRAARRNRMPEFLESDDMDEDQPGRSLLAGTKMRARRQYDERKDLDDMAGIEDVCINHNFVLRRSSSLLFQEIPIEQLGDIKAKSIVEWIANERVRRSIIRHFRQFLMTYVDEHGASVYGQRIRHLGESKSKRCRNSRSY